jgi:hypothetical protein
LSPPASRSFTVRHSGRRNVLVTKVKVGLPFDPATQPPPAAIEVDGVWDTGATNTVISDRLAAQLGCPPVGQAVSQTANGPRTCSTHVVSMAFPHGVGFPSLLVTTGSIVGCDVLVGMDIIGLGDLAVSSDNGKTVFSFQMPSAGPIDFVQQVQAIPAKSPSPGHPARNALCPCGSGKKAKRCCYP